MSRCCSTTELTARLEVRADYYPIKAERAILFLNPAHFMGKAGKLPALGKTLIFLPMRLVFGKLKGTFPKCDEQTFNFCIMRRGGIQRFRGFPGSGRPGGQGSRRQSGQGRQGEIPLGKEPEERPEAVGGNGASPSFFSSRERPGAVTASSWKRKSFPRRNSSRAWMA